MNNLLTSFQNLKIAMRKRSHRLAGLDVVQLLQQCRPGTDEDAANAILRGSQPLHQHDWATIASNLGRLAAQAGLQPITAAKLKAGEILRASATVVPAKVAVAQSRPLISSINPRNYRGYTPRQTHTPHRAATPKPAKPHVVRPAKPAALKPPPKPKPVRNLRVNSDRLEYTIRKAGLTFIAMARKVNQSNTVVYYWLKRKVCHPGVPAALGVTAENLLEPLSAEQKLELETLRHMPKATKESKPRKGPALKPPRLPSVVQSILAKITDEGLKTAAASMFTRLGAKQARAIARARKALKTAAFNASSQDFDLLALVILRT